MQKANLQLEKLNLEKDLSLRNRELTMNVMSLVEKNELISDISERLKHATKGQETADIQMIRNLIHELHYQPTDNLWEEFNIRFCEIHPNFYIRLGKEFPKLTPGENRLCAFLKMNLSTKEISMITHKSEHSIKIARYRLRHKLDLTREENLTAFLGRY